MAASQATGKHLRDQRIVFVGAGAAGCGIAETLVTRMKVEGLGEEEARRRIFMVDRFGLLTSRMPNLLDFQVPLAQNQSDLEAWGQDGENISLLETVRNAKPTVLIGVSGQPGLFTEEMIRTMHRHCEYPVIMPLSNPTSRAEATPEAIIRFTQGQAWVATGSPYPPVLFRGKTYPISQCNNAYVFPGIGLGVIASGAKRVTDGMLMAASEALAEMSPAVHAQGGSLLPDLREIETVSRTIALRVGLAAMKDGVSALADETDLLAAIEKNYWYPRYRSYIPAQNSR